jgi:glycosyltransferase involved in cell wall biosynthesis
MVSVSVIIPTYKRVDMLERCLEGVYAMDRKPDQVVVVYRPADDLKTRDWIQSVGSSSYPDIDVIEVKVPGVVAALNAGLAKAQKEIIVIYDDDAVPRKNWLDKILPHYSDPQVAGVGGRDVIHPLIDQKEIERGVGVRGFWGKISGGHHLAIGPARNVDTLKGCNMSFRKSVLGSLVFDQRLNGIGAQVGNECWFCLNIINAGWTLRLEPSAIVDHYPAEKEDYARNEFSEYRCFESTVNSTALELASLNKHQKVKYILHSLIIGSRNCPGIFFMIHSLVKRPTSLWGQLKGGWSGFLEGYRLAQKIKAAPPGLPVHPLIR